MKDMYKDIHRNVISSSKKKKHKQKQKGLNVISRKKNKLRSFMNWNIL